MRKIMAVVLSVASLGVFAATGEASVARKLGATGELSPTAPQVRIQIGGRRDNYRRYNRYGGVRTERQTRIVSYGRRTFRETYLVRYFPDGRTQTVLVDRERVG